MIIGESGAYIGIIIMGAMIVLVTAFLIIKSTPKKGTSQRQSLENIKVETAVQKRPALSSRTIDDSKASAIRKIKGDILKGIRALRKRSTSPDQQPIDEGLAINEQLSTRLPDLASLGLQGSTLPSLVNREALNTEPADEQETEGNMIDSSSAESVESTQETPQEELERVEPESEEEDKAPDNEPQEQPEAKKDVFDMFRDEMVEESEASKFAATLDNVDVHDLLEEAQRLVNNFSRPRD